MIERPPLGYVIKILVPWLFLLCVNGAHAQLREIRQLQRGLPYVQDSIVKNDMLNRLAQLMAGAYPDSGYYYVAQAKAMAERIGYKRGLAMAYKTYAILLTGTNSYLAANYLSDCIDLFKAVGDKESESMALMNIANLLYADDDSVNGNVYMHQSYQLSLMLAKDSVQSIVMNNLNLHSADYLSPLVDSLYKKGSAIAQKYQDDRMMLYFRSFEAYRLWDKGQRDTALQILKGSLLIADSIGNEYVKLSIYAELGDRYLMVDTAIGLQYYKKGLEEADRYRFGSFKVVFAKALYTYLTKAHRYSEAINYITILLDVQEKHNELLRRYGFSIVSYVNKDKELKVTRKLEQSRTLLLVVFIGLLVMTIAVLFFVFRSFLVSKRHAAIQKTLAEESASRNRELEKWHTFHNMLLSVLAHDLRQPFSAIMMTTDVFASNPGDITPNEMEVIMLSLRETGSKSIDLLEGLLLWVKSKKENFEYAAQPLFLQDMIKEANGLYAYDQQKKKVTLINEVPDKLVIHAHKQMALFINRNLISNATKFSPKGGAIRVFAQTNEEETIVGFEDQGPGMTPDELQKLFKVENDVVFEVNVKKGAGIALSICSDMIHQMNGRLWVESKPGKGSIFFYALSSSTRKIKAV